MNKLENLLINEQLRKDLLKVINLAINSFNVKDCFWIGKNIGGSLTGLGPEAKEIFNRQIKLPYLKAKWISLLLLNRKEVTELIRQNLLVIRELDKEVFNLTEAVKNYLIGITLHEERDQLKSSVRQALLGNAEVIDKTAPLKTTGEWLKDIIAKIGLQLDDTVKESEYYIRDEHFKKLKKEDQDFLKEVISLYKYCLYSSQDPEGIDEHIPVVEDGKLKIIEHGQISDVPAMDLDTEAIVNEFINTATVDKEVLKKIEDQYHRTFAEMIAKDLFNKGLGGSRVPSVILDNLNSNLALKDITLVMADLRKLIEVKGLNELLKSDYFFQSFTVYADSQMGAPSKNVLGQLSPEVLSLFLKFLLVYRLKISLDKAAILVMYLGNLLAKQGEKQYLQMVYADSVAGTFKWREIEIVDGKLKFV